jgi:phospholipase/carboxylesterase
MNSDTLLEREIIETGPAPERCVIWLHGLGADGFDFVPLVPELRLPDTLPVRFVFPHAPHQPVTINGGYIMRAWYDIIAPDLRARQDADGIKRSQQAVIELIHEQQDQGIPASHILLAGFSQGGAIALYTALRYPEPLAGVLALSTYLPLADTSAAELQSGNLGVPLFMAHGDADPIVPLTAAVQSRHRLQELGFNVEWHEYAMQHSMCQEEIGDVSQWLQQVLG